MNDKPIEQARNADLRGSWPALQRAALRARELAIRTGTDLIVVRNGVIEHIKPEALEAMLQAHEPHPPYGEQP